MTCSSVQQNRVQKSTLYSVVFDAVAVRYVVAFVFMFFVLHPVVPAFASEDVPEDISEDAQVVSQLEPKPVEEVPEPEESVVSEEEVLEIEESVVSEEEVPEPEESVVSEEEVLEVEAQNFIEAEESSETAQEPSEDVVEDSLVASSSEETTEMTPAEEEITDETILTEEVDAEVEVLEDFSATSSEASSTEVFTEESPEPAVEVNENFNTETDEGTETENSGSTNGTALEELSKLLSNTDGDMDEPSGEVAGTSTTQEGETEEDTGEVVQNEEPQGDEESADSVSGMESYQESEVVHEDVSEATTIEEIATSTSKLETAIVMEVSHIMSNTNRHQFSDTECLAVGEGSFYCTEAETVPEYIEDRVFSAPDSDGDTEIFVTISGETTQITHNTVDDAAPQYDAISDTIVWHSMKNDRFQIVQYTVSDGSVEYLTDSSYVNTEPVAYGDIVMWQAWIGNNWEIMLSDNGEVMQLTDNDVHDITPQMRDGYIMWQTKFAEGWKVALFDQVTQKVSYIADSDGTGVANPRFVLVYDSTNDVGDVRTLGYDFGSGSSFILGSLPAEMPEEVPEPDQTGETRALIQIKPSTRDAETEDVQPVPSNTGTSTNPPASTTSNLLSSDLIIAPLDIVATSTPDAVEEVLTADDVADAQVTEVLAKPEEDVSHIADVVIPPFMGTTTDEVG
jgi:hypothetical protein